ncbi:MAG TPA: flagellar biosynthetic protein FliR [Patescibacteria group bacterium]|nr:flagellar biosynthetic protein FliR [Patescibacteria group bacterium]
MELDFQNWLLVFLRVSAFVLVLPFFSVANFPVRLRVALAALTALLISPLLPPASLSGAALPGLMGVMIQEVSIGLLLGFMSRMVFYAVDLAGNFVSAELGLNMGVIFNPLEGQSSQVPGTILFFLASVVMFTLDLHHWVLAGFQQTYAVLPVGAAHLNGALFEMVLKHTGHIFIVALQISAPIIAVSFVVTLVFSVLSRAVSQMNVFSESFAFRIAGGLIVFGFTLQLTGQHVLNYLHRLPEDLIQVGQALAGG